MSYKEVAFAAKKPAAARAVANIMAKNYDPTVPCHRVIRSDGGLGGYNRGGIEKKRSILISEGYTMQHMFSNPEIQRIEGSIARLRTELQGLQREDDEARERERKAISLVQLDAERDHSRTQHKRTDLEREIGRHEQDLKRKQEQLERESSNHH